jgi:hypothetical protein
VESKSLDLFGTVETTTFGALKDTNPKEAIGDKKVPLWLLSPLAKAEWAQAQFVGQVKYGAWNWRVAGVRASTYISAIERHLDAFKSGEQFDPTDGTNHFGNIMACAAIMIDAMASNKLTDDRPPSIDLRPTYKAVEQGMEGTKVKYSGLSPTHYTIKDTGK